MEIFLEKQAPSIAIKRNFWYNGLDYIIHGEMSERVMNSAPEIWKKVLSLMEGDLTSTTLSTWFDDAEALSLEADRLVLYTPTGFKRDIIVSRYVPHIQKALRELFFRRL